MFIHYKRFKNKLTKNCPLLYSIDKKLNCIFDYSGSPFQSKKMSVVTVETVHTEDTIILKCK